MHANTAPHVVMRTLLLAGGTDGIGLAFLKAECQRDKYTLIYVLGRDFRQVDALQVGGGRVVNIACDITDASAMRQSLVDAAIRRVDDFVNTIGTFSRGPVCELTDEEVSSHFELNCVGNINLIRAVLPLMLPQQGGGDDAAEAADGRAAPVPQLGGGGTGAQILVCTASLALEARSPYALQSATKGALKLFVDALRIELRGRVRVMSVLPHSRTWNTPCLVVAQLDALGLPGGWPCSRWLRSALWTGLPPSRAQWAAAVLKSPNPRLSPPRPSVDTRIFAKAGDARDTSGYQPASRVADAMRWMLDCPPDVCVPELLLEQHRYEC